MSMNKKNQNAYLNQYTDNVIKRGYEIYDEWNDKKLDSRKIVASTERALKLFKKKKSKSTFIDVLAHIFALDTRIKEKYSSILSCLFAFFSWRRETRALGFLKSELNIPLGETDIRNVIVLELEKYAEKLEEGWDEDGDDETHGGKSNEKSEEEAKAAEEQAEEQSKDENAEKTPEEEEAEQASEEKEEIAEREQIEEPLKEDVEKAINEQEETELADQNDKEEIEKEEHDEIKEENNDIKEENNGENEKSEPSKDKSSEAKTYNDAVDSPPLFDMLIDKKPSEKISFIDEVIMDNMIKGKEDIIGHNPLEDVRQAREENQLDDNSLNEFLENQGEEKDANPYDKTEQISKDESQQNVEHSPEKTTEPQKEQTQNENKSEPEKQEPQDSKVQPPADTVQEKENEIRREISDNLSAESVSAIYEDHADKMREQLSIASAELGIDAPVEIIGRPEPLQVKQPVVNRK